MNVAPTFDAPHAQPPQNGEAARSLHISRIDLDQALLYASHKIDHFVLGSKWSDTAVGITMDLEISPYTEYLRVWVHAEDVNDGARIDITISDAVPAVLDTSRIEFTGPGVYATSLVFTAGANTPNDLDIDLTTAPGVLTLDATLTALTSGYISRIILVEQLYDITKKL